MTECTTDRMRLSGLGRRRVEADFGGGRLTSDAGLLLLREADRRTGLSAAAAACIGEWRDPARIVHDRRAMLAQRVLAIAAGYEDLNDHQTMRADPALQVAAGVEPAEDRPLASPPTLCRLEQRITRPALAAMHGVLVDQFIASFDTPPKELVLDFDATDDPLHGEQEGRFFHGYYDRYCYLPLYVFCGERLLVAYLRRSDIDPARHSRAILKLLTERLRAAWPGVKITFRGDSGFCRWRLMRWCDRHDVRYILGLARNKVLERRSEGFAAEAEAAFEWSGEKQRRFHEIEYAAGTWDRQRRVIVKAEHLSEGGGGRNTRFVVTNLQGDPGTLYDQVYCQRGEMENRIKEQQMGLFADRTSCRTMLANQFRLLLSSFAYTLIEHLRRTALAGTQLARAQATTIRVKLLKVAARVLVSARRVVFHLAGGYPLQPLMHDLVQRLVPD